MYLREISFDIFGDFNADTTESKRSVHSEGESPQIGITHPICDVEMANEDRRKSLALCMVADLKLFQRHIHEPLVWAYTHSKRWEREKGRIRRRIPDLSVA